MNQKSEQKLKSREAIVASAASLLRKRGIGASSVGDVMKGAGLTVGGFYGHFDSKEALFARTIQETAGTLWNRLLANAAAESPRTHALQVVRRYLSRSHRDNAETGCLLPSVAPEVAREGGPYREALEHELGGFARSFGAILGKGAREKSMALIALMYGALSLSRAVAGTPLSDEFLRAARRYAEHLIDAEPPTVDSPPQSDRSL